MGYKRGDIQVADLSDNDIALLARFGDDEAFAALWQRSIAIAEKVTHKFANKYDWINQDDLTQSVLAEFPKIINRYKPNHPKQVGIRQYLYFAFYRATQDALRKEDPLGIRIPQKNKTYPKWSHLSTVERKVDSGRRGGRLGIEGLVLDGMNRIDRGFEVNLDNG
jgi:hypothetical protein